MWSLFDSPALSHQSCTLSMLSPFSMRYSFGIVCRNIAGYWNFRVNCRVSFVQSCSSRTVAHRKFSLKHSFAEVECWIRRNCRNGSGSAFGPKIENDGDLVFKRFYKSLKFTFEWDPQSTSLSLLKE